MQYITKENLPVFKYVNILPAEFYEDAENDLSLLMEYHERLKSGLTNGDAKVFSDKSSDDVHRLVMKCFDYYPKAFFSDGPGQQGILSKIKEKITKINPETGNENLIGIEMFTVIGLCIRLLNIITFTRILQGAIFDQGEDKIYYPKLFLITDTYYKSQFNQPVMDFDALFRFMPANNSYETFIQGNIRESKQGFHIRKVSDEKIVVSIWDRVCGGYTFSLIKEGEGSYLLVPFVGCGRKKDLKRCNKWKGSEKSCVEKFSDCPERRIQTVHAILLCMQEYFIRKSRSSITKDRKKKNKTNSPETKTFQIEGMISVFDYGTKPINQTKKIGGTGISGVQKHPHIRSGHERHLQNGSIVQVRGCVVHKEEYEGYSSAERIK